MAAFKAAGMDDVKIIIGGAPVSEDAMKITGADEWAHSPQKTVSVCQDGQRPAEQSRLQI